MSVVKTKKVLKRVGYPDYFTVGRLIKIAHAFYYMLNFTTSNWKSSTSLMKKDPSKQIVIVKVDKISSQDLL